MLKAEVKNHYGVPALFIDDEPITGSMHWNRYPTVEDAEIFRNAGVNLFSFMGRLELRKNGAETGYNDGFADLPELTADYIDKTMSMLIKVNPDIKVLPRFRITVPDWWALEVPESLACNYSIQRQKMESGPHVSLSHAGFRNIVGKAISETVRQFESKWGNYVFGYQSGLYECGEHAYRWGPYVSDLGNTQLPAFREWLKKKYKSVESLRKAWNDTELLFENISFPPIAQFFPSDGLDCRMIFDSTEEMAVIDFLAFSSEIMADAVVFQANRVKDTLRELGREKVFGAFYGYLNLSANMLNNYGLGHYAIDKIYACDDIDFIAAPIGYDCRQKGGVAIPQVFPASIALNGKLYYAEDDTRCHLALKHWDCVADSQEETQQILLRNFLDIRRCGGSVWWMDLFGEGWFREKHFENLFRNLDSIAKNTTGYLSSNANIAVFVSDSSRVYERCAPVSISGNLTNQTLNEIAAIGASYDLYRIEDLPKLVEKEILPQYKFCIMLETMAISEEIRNLIKNHLQCNGRTILWFYLSGYICNGKESEAATCDLTGIRLKNVKNLRSSMITETWMDDNRISYGHPRNITPSLVSCDDDAENLGFYVEGIGADHHMTGNGASLVSKRFDYWRSVWSSSPNMPSCLFTKFAKEAGVHLYSSQGDQIFSLNRFLGIYAKFSGLHRISLPKESTVSDYFTSEVIVKSSDSFSILMERGECRFFCIKLL